MPALLSIIYVSHSSRLMSREEIHQLLDDARERNQQAGITGILLHADGNFMQYIEGDPATVEATFARIKRNPAHRNIIELQRKEICEREFADYSMAYWTPERVGFVKGSQEQSFDVAAAFNAIHSPVVKALLGGFCDRSSQEWALVSKVESHIAAL